MILTKKFQVFPDKESKDKLWDGSDCCVDIWNCANEQRQMRSGFGKVNLYSQKKELALLKKEFEHFKRPSSQVLQNVLFSLDRSYKQFFTKLKQGDKRVKRPKFKSKKYFFSQEYSQPKTSFTLDKESKILSLAYGKSRNDWIHVSFLDSLPFPSEQVKTCIIHFDSMEKKWYASVTYVFEEVRYQKNNVSLYFDPGSKTTLTGITSDGNFVEYDIHPLRTLNMSTYKHLDELISKRDNLKSKKSKRAVSAYRRLNRRIKKGFRKINTRTKMYLHRLANDMLDNHPDVQQFYIGDWAKQTTLADTKNTFANKTINRAVQNNLPLGKLIDYLTYKAKMRGKVVEKFDERGTTRTCTKCNKQHPKGVSTTARTFQCIDKHCNFRFSRDHHSCLNFIKHFEPALWRCLVEQDNLPTRSEKRTFAPFSLKSQIYSYQL